MTNRYHFLVFKEFCCRNLWLVQWYIFKIEDNARKDRKRLLILSHQWPVSREKHKRSVCDIFVNLNFFLSFWEFACSWVVILILMSTPKAKSLTDTNNICINNNICFVSHVSVLISKRFGIEIDLSEENISKNIFPIIVVPSILNIECHSDDTTLWLFNLVTLIISHKRKMWIRQKKLIRLVPWEMNVLLPKHI